MTSGVIARLAMSLDGHIAVPESCREHPRKPLVKQGGTTLHFVTEGPERALEPAREAVGGKDASPAGGLAGRTAPARRAGLAGGHAYSVAAAARPLPRMRA
ncbi:hypothetical protein [Streptomyces fulvoviolaceus]|uniref:hypothetical protein n=1 Tax=Streptomyces fulvoviolaceus TaxID=285535 RepID=UPI000AA70635|nr:hypothetical protein [Streptomyces fulvoviolaceus]